MADYSVDYGEACLVCNQTPIQGRGGEETRMMMMGPFIDKCFGFHGKFNLSRQFRGRNSFSSADELIKERELFLVVEN